MSSPDAHSERNLHPDDVWRSIARDLSLELGEPVSWSPSGFGIRGDVVQSPAAVRAIAGGQSWTQA